MVLINPSLFFWISNGCKGHVYDYSIFHPNGLNDKNKQDKADEKNKDCEKYTQEGR